MNMNILISTVNAGVVIWLMVLTFDDPSDGLVTGGLAILFCLNIYLLSFAQKGNDWLSLFLKRKALQEKKRIEDLETNKS
ncbi:hypothetical protein HY624_01095 [Candidatus Uhrbacteria bacterium]|nr:hypothetical protein [Candidatus Uhrbacteria bacterium]